MTVNELIEELRKYPGDMQCLRPSCPGGDTFLFYDPIAIKVKKVIIDDPGKIWGKEYAGVDDFLTKALVIS